MLAGSPFHIPVVSAGLGRMGNGHQDNEYFTLDGVNICEKWVTALLHDYASTEAYKLNRHEAVPEGAPHMAFPAKLGDINRGNTA